jgi:hypothetical protein
MIYIVLGHHHIRVYGRPLRHGDGTTSSAKTHYALPLDQKAQSRCNSYSELSDNITSESCCVRCGSGRMALSFFWHPSTSCRVFSFPAPSTDALLLSQVSTVAANPPWALFDGRFAGFGGTAPSVVSTNSNLGLHVSNGQKETRRFLWLPVPPPGPLPESGSRLHSAVPPIPRLFLNAEHESIRSALEC